VVIVASAVATWLLARRRPSALVAARALDEALGLPDVVASGISLHADTEFETLARRRAADAVAGRDAVTLLPHPRQRVRLGRGALATLALTLAALAGAYEPALVQVLTAPPTIAELDAADALAEAARSLGGESDEREEPREERDEAAPEAGHQEREVEALARSVQRALARGDRDRALERLAELRRSVDERRAGARSLDRLADRLARHLEPTPGTTPSSSSASPSASPRTSPRAQTAEERMRLLARRVREASASPMTAQERERTLERLARTADEARRGGGRDAEQLAEALSRAQAALGDGRMEEAARALEEAAARSERLSEERERAMRDAEALARLLERAGTLERAMQLARLGESGEALAGLSMSLGDGEGEGEGGTETGAGGRGLAEGLAARLAALGLAEGPPGVGHGPGRRGGDRRTDRAGLPTHGDVHARSQVREGERAVGVLEGLGQNADAERGYADVYPSYGAVAEDALANERVPAARREAVRRYFEAIRPGAERDGAE
jgi:tetratricopeptide (TPR) repeat protein